MIYDVLIIGAGPCGLAVAARLREQTPSALFTEDEHNRFWRKSRRVGHRMTSKLKTANTDPSTAQASGCSVLVLDAHSPKWMSSWEAKFEALQISHLRSPLFFHPDPQDRDGLLAYAHEMGRCDEMCRIDGVVGKELSKHQRKKKNKRQAALEASVHQRTDQRDESDYFRPSRKLFASYCDEIVKRYDLGQCLEKQTVKNVLYGEFGPVAEGKLFQVEADDATYLARSVVLAAGAGSKVQIPTSIFPQSETVAKGPCHCFQDATTCKLPPHVMAKLKDRLAVHVVVVGGGLTGAQLCDLFIRQGVSKVWLLLRSNYKVKHFDLDLEWVTKLRNHNLARFWSADSDNERLEMLKNARNGGSITPEYDKILQRHVSNGHLCILPNTQVTDTHWNADQCKWEITTSPVVNKDPLLFDHVVYATEHKACLEKVSCISALHEQCPAPSLAGLPLLTDDLMWRQDVPLFFTGQLAALRLGPGAGNLSGARLGAERIAWKIEKLMSIWHEQDAGAQDREEAADLSLRNTYLLDNRYEILASA